MQIKNRWTGAILFEGNFDTMRFCVEAAVKAGAYLAYANLAGANLDRANLARAKLDRAYLASANLAGADLDRANLARANLAGANLDRANLAGANLAGANLDRANLAYANLAYANLDRANLARAKISNDVTLKAGPLRRATRADGYDFFLWPTDKGFFVQAGCRWFTFEEAWLHWCGPRAERLNTRLGDETMDILTMFSLALDRVENAK